MKISQININGLLEDIDAGVLKADTSDIVDRLLFRGLSDSGEYGDFVMVFGSPSCTRHRAPAGAELMLAGRAEMLLLSGGKALPGEQITEAQAMKEVALEMGVSEDKICLENASMFTHENVSLSSELIKKLMPGRPLRILAVTSANHMRRVMLNFEHFKACFPAGSKFYACPSKSEYAGRGNWHLTPKGREIAARECGSLFEYVRLGYLPDIEI